MHYEELLIEADTQNLIVREKDIPGYGGRIYKNRIAIHKGLDTSTEKSCILAEELGRYHTTYGNILDLSITSNRKQELRARAWAYDRLVGLSGIISCFEAGCRYLFDMAEYLEVTEEFLKETIKRYRQKYGAFATTKNYIIYFEPVLGVMKITDQSHHL